MSFINTIIKKYTPYFYFHKKEKYYPVTPDFYLKGSCLYDEEEKKIIDNDLTQKKLYFHSGSKNYKLHYLNDRLVKTGFDNNVPIYAYVKEENGKTFIIYIIFYLYNGAYKVLGKEYGNHHADIEHVTIELNNTFEMIRVYFSAHGYEEGIWKDVDEIQTVSGRPVVYVSKYSHANYHRPGIVFRHLGFANDKMNKGKIWSPKAIRVYDEHCIEFDVNNSWIHYPGTWTLNGIWGVTSQRWFNEIEKENGKHKFIYPYTNFFYMMYHVTKTMIKGNLQDHIDQI